LCNGRYDGALEPVEEPPESLELDFANDKLRRLRRAFEAQKRAQQLQGQLDGLAAGAGEQGHRSGAHVSVGGAAGGDPEQAWAVRAVAAARAAAERVSAAAAHAYADAAGPLGLQPGAVAALGDALRTALAEVESLGGGAVAPVPSTAPTAFGDLRGGGLAGDGGRAAQRAEERTGVRRRERMRSIESFLVARQAEKETEAGV
jgi:hypothetical protein